jgi:hypothetical protein
MSESERGTNKIFDETDFSEKAISERKKTINSIYEEVRQKRLDKAKCNERLKHVVDEMIKK